MALFSRRTVIAVALAAAACGGGTEASRGTPITCAWLAGPNCWKTSVAAATACTNELATGAFDPPTTTCSYADGTSVRFDPSWPATASYAAGGTQSADAVWDFTVLTTSATTCAHFRRTGQGITLTTALGTFTMSDSPTGLEFTCPDGGRYSLDGLELVQNCLLALPGYSVSGRSPMTFGLANGGGGDLTLWKCQ